MTLLLEGMSVRAVSRFTDVHQETILNLLLRIGKKCWTHFNKSVRNIRSNYVQADELWTFVHTKEGYVHGGDPRIEHICTPHVE